MLTPRVYGGGLCTGRAGGSPGSRGSRSTPDTKGPDDDVPGGPRPRPASAPRLRAARASRPRRPRRRSPASTTRSAVSSRRGARCGSRARSRRGTTRTGNVFGRMKDLATDATISFRIWSTHPAAPARRSHGRRPRHRVRQGRLLRQDRRLQLLRVVDAARRTRRPAREARAAARASCAPRGCSTPARKKPIPFLPHVIGLITGEKSDAEKDVRHNAELRWPQVRFRTAYAAVQGDRCVPETIGALKALDADPTVDVIVIARGGGDPQHLLGLQRRATAAGGGRGIHPRRQRDRPRERPSAAGRRRGPPRLDADRRREARRARTSSEQRAVVAQLRSRLTIAALAAGEPRHRAARAAALASGAAHARDDDRRALAAAVAARRARARRRRSRGSRRRRRRAAELRAALRALSPASTLARGYAIAHLADGVIVRDAAQAPPGTAVARHGRARVVRRAVRGRDRRGRASRRRRRRRGAVRRRTRMEA